MCMPHPTFESQPSLRPSQIADLRLAASKMTGPKRRAFEAEMTLGFCDCSAGLLFILKESAFSGFLGKE
jgi:hypothetical protein